MIPGEARGRHRSSPGESPMSSTGFPAPSLEPSRLPRLRNRVAGRAVSADMLALGGVIVIAVLTAVGFIWFGRAYREPSRRNVIWWTALSSLALMTHFFAGLIVAPEAIWLLWRWRSRLIAGAIGVVVVVQLAMAPFALFDTTHGTQWISSMPPVNRIGNLVLEWDVGTLYRRAGNVEGLLGGALLLVLVGVLMRFGGDRELRARAKLPAVIAAFVFVMPLVFGVIGLD